jgi:arylsulfotransferase ASST
MSQLTRRSLLGGATAIGAGALLPGTSHASTPAPRQLRQDPPGLEILTRLPGTAPGLLFLTPQGFAAPDTPRGPQIVDDEGQVIWFHQIPNGTFATDFRVQTYQGADVLTWWEGTSAAGGVGSGVGHIANANYEIIATVETPDTGEALDLHEFLLTPEGTALVISFRDVPHDLTPVGGPADGTAYDCVVQEIDIATGASVLDWHGIDHVAIGESEIGFQQGATSYDYLHVNSVSLDVDGNLLVSGRHTSTLYKINRTSGEVIWRLGGSNSDFQLGSGARFVGQHDGHGEGGNVYRLFDNGTQIGRQSQSRVAWIEVDPDLGTAELQDEVHHPEALSAVLAEGGAQRLPNDNTMVSWGQASRISEFSPTGELLFDAALPQGISSYRAYRMEWQGAGTRAAPRSASASGTK